MQTYLVTWECASRGWKYSFCRAIDEELGWPDKFEGLKCRKEERGHVQDVPFRVCQVSPIG